ncbi:MAG: autotransporter outer membrane beta-barrel domain-containing protein [Pseudomonadota bacterium]
MVMKILVRTSLAAATLVIGTSLEVNAQSFTDADGSFRAHVATICPILAQQRDTATDEQDLFLRCNGALSEPLASTTLPGLTAQGDILDQYLGVQNIAQQSDATTRANRADQAVAGRISAVSGQLRGRQFASLVPQRPVILASNNPDEISLPAGPRNRALDGFVTIGGYDGEQDSTSQELGFNQDGFYVAAGLDYAFSERLIGGGAISYVDGSADFDGIGGTSSGGSLDTESISLSIFGVFLPDDKWEVNGLVSVGQADFSNSRIISVIDRNGDAAGGGGQSDPGSLAVIDRVASSDSDADTLQLQAGTSYLLYNQGGVSFTPTAEVSYYYADIGAFSETGAAGLNLSYDSQEVDSLQLSAGGIWSGTVNANWGVFLPYARGRAIFELQDDEQSVRARYTAAERVSDSTFTITTNPADETSFDLAVGASAVLPNGFSGFAEYQAVLGLENVTHQAIALGLRVEF